MEAFETNTAKGRVFERRVGRLFELQGCIIQHDVEIAGRQIDLIVEERRGIFQTKYLVECKDQDKPVTTAQYDAFKSKLASAANAINPRVRGIMVASTEFVKEARAQSEHDDIRLITIAELERQLLDFTAYVHHLMHRLQVDPRLSTFVLPDLRREHNVRSEPANELIDEWMLDAQSNHLTILGDYGTGKSTLLKYLALQMAQRFEELSIRGGARARVPLLIDLRKYTQATSFQQIILDFLSQYGIKPASYATFEYVLREGQVVLLLDSFDEMASRGNYEATLQSFRDIIREALGRTKIILCCRTHYFTTDRDMRRFLGQPTTSHSSSPQYTKLYREIARRSNFQISYLEEFEADQVQNYLRQRRGSEAPQVWGFIQQRYELETLSRRPAWLEMIVDSYDPLSQRAEPLTPAVLYDTYVDIWLARNDWSSRLEVETKAELLETFAARVEQQPKHTLHFKAIPELVKSLNPGTERPEPHDVDRELRAASFLVRDSEGNYSFSHQPFQEYFLARYLLTCATRDHTSRWDSKFFSTHTYTFLRDMLTRNDEAYNALLAWIVDTSAPSIRRANAVKCATAKPTERLVGVISAALQNADEHLEPYLVTALGTYLFHGQTARLINIADTTRNHFTRLNAFIALARLRDPDAKAFLLDHLKRDATEFNDRLLLSVPFLRAVHERGDCDLAKACLAIAQVGRGLNRAAEVMLELSELVEPEKAISFHTQLLMQTQNPKLLGAAFERLPQGEKLQRLSRVLDFFDSNSHKPHMDRVLRSLQGVACPKVAQFLASVLDGGDSPYKLIAFEIIKSDYPEVIDNRALDWLRRGESYGLRGAVAVAYARRNPATGRPVLLDLLRRWERPTLKLAALELISEQSADSLAEVVTNLWKGEPTVFVKRSAMELLRRADPRAALDLMLTMGLNDKRAGARVAVCAALGSEGHKRVTKALLKVLKNDHSRWVRQRALQSLVTPGRELSRQEIQNALGNERDPEVIALAAELLGS